MKYAKNPVLGDPNPHKAYVDAMNPVDYASMNLAWGSAAEVTIAYLRRELDAIEVEHLEPGIHILANDRIGADGFPRAERLRDALRAGPLRWPEVADVLATHLADHTRGLFSTNVRRYHLSASSC